MVHEESAYSSMTKYCPDQKLDNFEIIFNTSPIGMFVLNEDSLIEKINDSALELLDNNREDVLGKRFGDGVCCKSSTEDRRGCGFGVQCLFCELKLATDLAFKTGQSTTNLEYRKVFIHNENEKEFYFRSSITPIMVSGKQNVVVALFDITDRKLAEDVSKRYQVLLENARDIILFVDIEGHIVEANHAAIKAYGYTREEISLLKINDLLEQDDLIIQRMHQADKTDVIFETQHICKDGTSFPVEVSSQRTTLGDKSVLVSIIRDISARKVAETVLRESENKYRSLFNVAQDAIFGVFQK